MLKATAVELDAKLMAVLWPLNCEDFVKPMEAANPVPSPDARRKPTCVVYAENMAGEPSA